MIKKSFLGLVFASLSTASLALSSSPFVGTLNTAPMYSGNKNETAYTFVTFGCDDPDAGGHFDMCIDTSVVISQVNPTFTMNAKVVDAFKQKYPKVLVRMFFLVDVDSWGQGDRQVTLDSPMTPDGYHFKVPTGESVKAYMTSEDGTKTWHSFDVVSNNAE